MFLEGISAARQHQILGADSQLHVPPVSESRTPLSGSARGLTYGSITLLPSNASEGRVCRLLGCLTVVRRALPAPALHPGSVVVLDNLGAHKVDAVRRIVEAGGARLLFLPQYSPELNAIEEAWSKVKNVVRSLDPRTHRDVDKAIVAGCDAVTPEDAAGWIRHAGYRIN